MSDALSEVAHLLIDELEGRFPYAAAWVSGTSGIRIRDSGNVQDASEDDPARGIVFTLYDGHAFQEFATSELRPDPLARAVRDWSSQQTVHPNGRPLVGAGYASPVGPDRRSFSTAMQTDPQSVPLAEKLRHVRDLQQRAQAIDTRIVQVQVQYADSTQESLYIGRGRELAQRVTRTNIFVLIAVSDGNQLRYHYHIRGKTAGYETAQVTDDELVETAEVALRLLSAGKIEPGVYDTVTDSSISGVIAHECFGHGVELDLFPKGRARSAQYLNRPVAAPAVQMYDDPSVLGAHGSYFFDDEGELARPTQILRDGVLVHPISDMASATFTPGVRTANGRRENFSRKVYARMTNTYFGAGEEHPAAMLADVEHGIYLRAAESGMEDPMGWGIQVTAHYGEEIRDGQLTGRLFAPVGISGYVPDLLRSISAIGNDLELDPGYCGKGHKEMVPVSSGGPHLRMRARLG